MITQRFSLRFHLKKPLNYNGGKKPVYLRITVGGERAEFSVNRQFDPSRWNNKTARANGTKEDARSLNAYLDMLQVKVFEAHRELITEKREVTAEKIKAFLTGKNMDAPKMLLQIFAEHNKNMSDLISVGEYARGTQVHFETTYKHVAIFLKIKYQARDIDIQNIDYAFIYDFEVYLKSQVCAHNTAMKYLGDLKKIILICLKKGWLTKDPFLGYKMSRREVKKDFLVDEELQAIANKRFSTQRLELVRNIFLFSCLTGLAYADVKNLKYSEIRTGVDGQRWMFIVRQKSGTSAAIPLLPAAIEILNKYKKDVRCINGGVALPVICNQKMNEYLKEIAEVCGICKTLTFHTARHTFATTITLNNNVPIESVSKMLGHKSLKQTQHYAKILNKKVGEDMVLLAQKIKF